MTSSKARKAPLNPFFSHVRSRDDIHHLLEVLAKAPDLNNLLYLEQVTKWDLAHRALPDHPWQMTQLITAQTDTFTRSRALISFQSKASLSRQSIEDVRLVFAQEIDFRYAHFGPMRKGQTLMIRTVSGSLAMRDDKKNLIILKPGETHAVSIRRESPDDDFHTSSWLTGLIYCSNASEFVPVRAR